VVAAKRFDVEVAESNWRDLFVGGKGTEELVNEGVEDDRTHQ
jgi:hypothetical protein